jgi:hypothetical protein
MAGSKHRSSTNPNDPLTRQRMEASRRDDERGKGGIGLDKKVRGPKLKRAAGARRGSR